MADEQAADVGGQTDIVQRSAGGDGALSAREAALSLLDTRRKEAAGANGAEQQEQTGEARETATAEESSSQEDGTAQETGPGETQEADAQAEQPDPIEPPRSWTKEDKELFKGLPRATQERLADRERSREADFLRRQNEAAEKTKGLTAKEAAAEQVRAQYEQTLPQLLQALQEQQTGGEFSDIKSLADVQRMAAEDWPKYVRWDAQQKTIAAVQKQVQEANQRQATEQAQKWQTFATDEDAKFAEKAPELATAEAKSKAAQGAGTMLKEMGFTDEELGKLWTGQDKISLRDHRIQLLIRDGVRYREAQKAAKAKTPPPVPTVQRPGPAPARTGDVDGRVKDLTERFNATGSLRDGAAALAARRAMGSRR